MKLLSVIFSVLAPERGPYNVVSGFLDKDNIISAIQRYQNDFLEFGFKYTGESTSPPSTVYSTAPKSTTDPHKGGSDKTTTTAVTSVLVVIIVILIIAAIVWYTHKR